MSEDIVRWKGASAQIPFEPEDFDVLDIVLNLIPELRICAVAVKRARASQIEYPIGNVDEIVNLLRGENFEGGGHHITEKDVRHYLVPEYFPIAHEGELVSRIYLALTRCNYEVSLASRVQPEALEIVNNLRPTAAGGV